VVVAAAAIGAALARPWPGRRGLVVLLVPLALAVVAFGVLEADWMEQLRFATPVWPLGALAAAVAVTQVLPVLAVRGRVVLAGLAAVAAVATGASFVDAVRSFRAAPTAPLCLVATNTGRAINGYAEVLGDGEHVLLAPDIGGAALTSTSRVVDLVGLADARIAAYWAEGDFGGLRDHVFDDVRPTFVTINPVWARITGVPDDPRMADYAEIGTSPAGVTDWVRRDALAPGDLDAMRARAAAVALPADLAARAAPRSSCGDLLVPQP
jgi:hypothetical protein